MLVICALHFPPTAYGTKSWRDHGRQSTYAGADFWATQRAGLLSSPTSVTRHSLGKQTPSTPFVTGQFVGQA